MKTSMSEKAGWHATVITFIVLAVILGVEQLVPLPDTFRSQFGVLTILLMFGFWHIVCGLVQPHEKVR